MSQKIQLWDDPARGAGSITRYPLKSARPLPAILVIPGGGYGSVCEKTEGSPIAHRFNRLGFHAFVLDYRVAPNRFPAPLQDAVRAMKLIRVNAENWNIDPHRIAACGFSAGAHLAASLGTIAEEGDVRVNDAADDCSFIPDALLLCYPVIALTGVGHTGSGLNLLGSDASQELLERYSLERRVHAQTPPAFLFHTLRDQIVDYHNSLLFAEAMTQAGRPCELHLYPYGDHGMLLGNETQDVAMWPELARRFLDTQWERSREPDFREHYTNAFQAHHL